VLGLTKKNAGANGLAVETTTVVSSFNPCEGEAFFSSADRAGHHRPVLAGGVRRRDAHRPHRRPARDRWSSSTWSKRRSPDRCTTWPP